MKLEEKQLNRKLVYDGYVFKVYQDDVLLPDGSQSKRDVVHHRGAVCIAAKKEDGTFLMVTQYRYALSRCFVEFVAGKKEENEDSLLTAQRELVEETGYEAKTWTSLGSMVPTCGYDDEVIDLYYAQDLTFTGQHLDDGEFLNVSAMTLDEIIKEIEEGKIQDAKTMILAYKIKMLEK